MIPLAIPDLSGNEARYLQECIATGFVSSVGPFVGRFEQAVAQAAGAPLAVATCSGTAGLHVALVALGVQRDDLVLLPSLTFIASANAIAYCGAEPWLVDVDPSSWNLDVALLEQLLQQECVRQGDRLLHRASGRRVAALLPVYTLGLPADMQRIVSLARQWQLPVVADAAAALGSAWQGVAVGALGADLTVFSFNGNKTVTCGGGGAVLGGNAALLQRVRHLATTARQGDAYDHDQIGFNYRMTNLQAAVGCAQLQRLDDFVAAKRRLRARYNAAFAGLRAQMLPFPEPEGYLSACWFSGGLLHTHDPAAMQRLLQRLQGEGVAARPFWKPIHLQQPYRQAPRSRQSVSEALWYRILTLPCSTALTEQEQEQVITAVQRCLT
ncbi:MAG: aminotransferase class I/II-fold pyridoxal phosphate-dependent enzyme [Magnetococcales bacterium]|nr:aminotransferase class I/II-fold pyridoxal phosphate-dependent enzyme [Magnetococcales bacterium]MBF0114196.1 aminotransferase class I/II-fold pyridoxal phosphate-dependent enzyme [Magnetococcales bacterium]